MSRCLYISIESRHRVNVHVEARVEIEEWERHTCTQTKHPKPGAAWIILQCGICSGSYETASDLHVEYDRYPQSATGGAQPNAKSVYAGARIMEVTFGKAP